MPLHSYTRCWLHLIWATLERRPLFSKPAAAKVSQYRSGYAAEKQIYLKINFVNSDHVHALIDLPAGRAINEVVQLFKGSSLHWINESSVVAGKFAWQRGYGAFSVSQSAVDEVAAYIAGQEEHHHKVSFADELKKLVERYELRWQE